MKLQKSMAMPYVILLGVLFGSNIVVSRFILAQVSSFVYVSLRLAIATLCYVLLFALSRNRRWSHDPSLWLRSSIYGILGTTIPMNAFIISLYYLSSGVVALLITLSTPVTAVLAHFMLDDEALNRQKFFGVVIAFFGAGMLLIRGETGLAYIARADWRGYAWNFFGVLIASLSNIYARKKLKDEDDIEVSSIYMLAAAVACIPIALFTTRYDLSAMRTSGYLALVYAGIFGSFLAFLMNFFIIKRVNATIGSANAYVSPVVTAVLGSLFLGELLTPVMIIGMVVIFIGLVLMGQQLRKPLLE